MKFTGHESLHFLSFTGQDMNHYISCRYLVEFTYVGIFTKFQINWKEANSNSNSIPHTSPVSAAPPHCPPSSKSFPNLMRWKLSQPKPSKYTEAWHDDSQDEKKRVKFRVQTMSLQPSSIPCSPLRIASFLFIWSFDVQHQLETSTISHAVL